jgi:hypothetical protein
MDPRLFYFPVVTLDASGQPNRLLGNSFPITTAGDLLTCRHVVSVPEGTTLAVLDNELGRAVPVTNVRFPAVAELDLALLPNALGRTSQCWPLLAPGLLVVGQDVNTYGFYAHGGSWVSATDGYFKGNVVSFRSERFGTITLSYAVIEGLSGSPVSTYHNGLKAVGICFGSESQRVLASEVVEFTERGRELRETVNRIVEFGLAYRVEVIQAFCAEMGVTPLATADRVDEPELG